MKLLEVSALINLATGQHGANCNIQLSSSFLFRCLGVPPTTRRASVPDSIPLEAAVAVLQLYDIPQDVALADVAYALAPPAEADQQQQQEQKVWLDSLIGLICLLSAGETADKLKLCYWALDRSSSNSLDMKELLALLPALPQTAAAARLILQQATCQSLAAEQADPTACAAVNQRMQMLSIVLQRAFTEADPQRTGVLRPGEQFKQLLFSVAAALTAIIIGAAPAPGLAESASDAADDADDTQFWSESGSAGFRSAIGSMTDLSAPLAGARASQSGRSSPAGVSPGSTSRSSSRQQQGRNLSSQQSPVPNSGNTSPEQLDPFLQQSRTPPKLQEEQPAGQGAVGPADVLILDPSGDVVHYNCTVEEAAAAAVSGKPPASMAGSGVHVYPQALAAAGGRTQPLSPAVSLSGRMSALAEVQQDLQQIHYNTSTGSASPRYFSPVNSNVYSEPLERPSVNLDGNYNTTSGSGQTEMTARSAGKQRYTEAADAVAEKSKRLLGKLRRSTSPEQADDGEQTDAEANAAAGSGAITTTAGAVLQSLQSNLAAAGVRVLSYCGLCFLLTTLVVLGDAALVAGLHVGADMQLAVAFGITVGANMVLMLMLVAVLVIVHIKNATNERSLQERLNSPGAQQLDQVIVNLADIVAALKKQEAQATNKQDTGTAAGTAAGTRASSLRRVTSVYTPEGAASTREFEMQTTQPAGALGFLSKIQPLWAAVGRIAGFQQGGLPLAGDSQSLQLRDSYEGPRNNLAIVSEDEGHVAAAAGNVSSGVRRNSSSTGEAASAAYSAVRPGGVYQQSRVVRVKGTAAPSASASNVGNAAGGISVKDAYPM